jgi:hypothetical protein
MVLNKMCVPSCILLPVKILQEGNTGAREAGVPGVQQQIKWLVNLVSGRQLTSVAAAETHLLLLLRLAAAAAAESAVFLQQRKPLQMGYACSLLDTSTSTSPTDLHTLNYLYNQKFHFQPQQYSKFVGPLISGPPLDGKGPYRHIEK